MPLLSAPQTPTSVKRMLIFIASITLVAGVIILLNWAEVSFSIPTAIFAGALTVVAGLVTQTWLGNRQNRREIEAKLRERKSEVYERFIKFWMDMLVLPENQRKRAAGLLDQDQLVTEMTALSQPFMLWPSNDVVRAYADFRQMANRAEREQKAIPPMETLFAFEDLIFLMRGDMGQSALGARRGDLLSFFVKNLEVEDDAIGSPWYLGQKPLGKSSKRLSPSH